MGTKKLETQLETVEIKQTRDQIDPIRFRDEAINKVKKNNYNFGKKRFKYIPFKENPLTYGHRSKGFLFEIFFAEN